MRCKTCGQLCHCGEYRRDKDARPRDRGHWCDCGTTGSDNEIDEGEGEE